MSVTQRIDPYYIAFEKMMCSKGNELLHIIPFNLQTMIRSLVEKIYD